MPAPTLRPPSVTCPRCGSQIPIGSDKQLWLTCPNCAHVCRFLDNVTPPVVAGPRSYSRRFGDYSYEIAIHEAIPPVQASHLCARVLNLVRLESGHAVAATANLQVTYGTTRYEAVSRMEAAVEAWVKDQKPRQLHEDSCRPKNGDLVVWDMKPEETNPMYWVRTHSRGSETQLFEGPDAWVRACSAAEERVGPDGTVWKRHKDGHFEKLAKG